MIFTINTMVALASSLWPYRQFRRFHTNLKKNIRNHRCPLLHTLKVKTLQVIIYSYLSQSCESTAKPVSEWHLYSEWYNTSLCVYSPQRHKHSKHPYLLIRICNHGARDGKNKCFWEWQKSSDIINKIYFIFI